MRPFTTGHARIAMDVFGHIINPLTKEMEKVCRFTLSNSKKMCVQIITLGATITNIRVPDLWGRSEEVLLGHDDTSAYMADTNHLGATIGRTCNIISNGRMSVDGQSHILNRNDMGQHHWNGGCEGFHKINWKVVCGRHEGVKLKLVTPNGYEGYPGELTTVAHFILSDDNMLKIRLQAESSSYTPVNLTNSLYFNLAGHATGRSSLYEHWLRLNYNRIVETDQCKIPTGKLPIVHCTVNDFRTIVNIGERISQTADGNGYETHFCESKQRQKATLIHPASGRSLTMYSNQPALWLHTANHFPDGDAGDKPLIGKYGARYVKHGAISLQSQAYPDAVNIRDFPSIMLCPGRVYQHEVIYRFGTVDPNVYHGLKWYPLYI